MGGFSEPLCGICGVKFQVFLGMISVLIMG